MTAIVARPALLIRRPIAEVFEAFVDPEITCRFWFSAGKGRLAPGATATWSWEMYGISIPARVTAFEAPHRITFEWGEGRDMTEVEWTFEERGARQTFVTVAHQGFQGSRDEQIAAALDGMNGFTLMLAAAKIWLEHGIEARFVLDRHPDMRVDGWKTA